MTFLSTFHSHAAKQTFQIFSLPTDNRFDRKISEPTENNLLTAAELRIAVLNLLNACNHASLLLAGKHPLVILSFPFPTHLSNLFSIVAPKFSATNYTTKKQKVFRTD